MNVVYGIVCELNVLELHMSSGCWPHSDSCISITCSSLLWNMTHTYPFLLKRNVQKALAIERIENNVVKVKLLKWESCLNLDAHRDKVNFLRLSLF